MIFPFILKLFEAMNKDLYMIIQLFMVGISEKEDRFSTDAPYCWYNAGKRLRQY